MTILVTHRALLELNDVLLSSHANFGLAVRRKNHPLAIIICANEPLFATGHNPYDDYADDVRREREKRTLGRDMSLQALCLNC